MAVIQQMAHTGGARLGDDVGANGVGNIRMRTVGPLLQHLRIAGVVIRIYQEGRGLFVLLCTAVFGFIIVRFNADTGVVVGIFGDFVDVVGAVIVRSNYTRQAVLQVILIRNGLQNSAAGGLLGLFLYGRAILVVLVLDGPVAAALDPGWYPGYSVFKELFQWCQYITVTHFINSCLVPPSVHHY